jgi:RHS repeat-associated protein
VQAGNILTVQTDHLDTPRQLTDNTKKVVWNWAYSAFGENQPTNINNTVFNLRYPGQYYDAESKLHYNINRYYDPATGRYTQSDPIGLSGGINTYTYVGGNSIRWSDRTGLIPPLVVGAYIFAVENAVTITGLVVAAAEIASGVPSPISAAESVVAKTIAQQTGTVASFGSFAAAKKALGSIDGHDIHHVVEQCQEVRSGFSKSMINSTDNLVRLPKDVHNQISSYYASGSPRFRDSLNGLPFEKQLQDGLDVVNQALNGTLKKK